MAAAALLVLLLKLELELSESLGFEVEVGGDIFVWGWALYCFGMLGVEGLMGFISRG